MTFVFELRDLKKSLPRPITHFWQQATGALRLLRFRLAFLGLLGCALDFSLEAGATAGSGLLALLCGVLTAAASATLGLMCEVSNALSALLSDQASPVFRFDQRLNLHFAEPVLKFDICTDTGRFPALSGHCLCALGACALLMFSAGFSRGEPTKQRGAG